MTAIRIAFLFLLFVAGFGTARFVLSEPRGRVSEGARPAAGARQDVVAAAPASEREKASREGVALERPPAIDIGSEPLTEWQRLIIADPERAPRTRAMIMEELYGYTARNPLGSCLAGPDGLVGEYKLLFETQVRSRGTRVDASPWRFVRVLDGTPIPDEVIACMEAILATPIALEGPPDTPVFLPWYDGTLQVDLKAFAPARAEAE